MRVIRVFIIGVVLALIAILSGIVQDVRDAQAIPAFARKYDFACNVCHVPWARPRRWIGVSRDA